ncbi:MAG: L,D-transpeptidase [Bradyrhizobiaceae bacterium]|nr:MAG: L,D-transpeptidase [Bradyrhizobiaceae bacterium]
MSDLAGGRRDFFALRSVLNWGAGLSVMAAAMIVAAPASAQSLSYAAQPGLYWPQNSAVPSGAPDNEASEDAALPDRLRRAVVSYPSREAPGTIIIDTRHTYLYLVLGGNRAIRYGVGVGREGFTWSGVQTISRKAEWPDWHPPAQMIARQPYLPRFVAGGPGNPLGARAMYLGHSDYRIHGTNDPTTIGKFVSSGCIRLTNTDVEDLFNRVKVGAKVIVLPKGGSPQFEAKRTLPSQASLTSSTERAGQPMQLSRLD